MFLSVNTLIILYVQKQSEHDTFLGMSNQNPQAWKQLIDPELDSAVRTLLRHVKSLKEFKLSGDLSKVNEITKNAIVDGPGWSSYYSTDALGIWKAAAETGLINKLHCYEDLMEYVAILSSDPSDPNKFVTKLFNHLRTIAQKLSKTSNTYYQKVIDTLFDGSFFKSVNESEGIEREKAMQECHLHMVAIHASIICRYGFQELDKFPELDIDVTPSEVASFANLFISGLFSLMSQIANKNTINELLTKGDDESICKAVMIDNTVMNTEIVKKKITEETLKGESKFRAKLSAAIAKNIISSEMPHYQTFLVLRYFWPLGLYRLKHEDLNFFLSACGLTPPNYPEGIRKFLDRNIHPIYEKYQI